MSRLSANEKFKAFIIICLVLAAIKSLKWGRAISLPSLPLFEIPVPETCQSPDWRICENETNDFWSGRGDSCDHSDIASDNTFPSTSDSAPSSV